MIDAMSEQGDGLHKSLGVGCPPRCVGFPPRCVGVVSIFPVSYHKWCKSCIS